MYLCKDYMASTLQKMVIPIFGYCNLSIPLLKHFIKVPPHKYKHYSLMFHTLFIQRLSFVIIILQVTLTFTYGKVLLFQQLLHNHDARLLQLCKVANTLYKLPQPCDNLVTTLQSCSKVATTQLFPYGYVHISL